jgi:hypothetical protein
MPNSFQIRKHVERCLKEAHNTFELYKTRNLHPIHVCHLKDGHDALHRCYVCKAKFAVCTN